MTQSENGWTGFKALDEAAGVVKGTAFRCFKRVEPQLVEGTDFKVLDVVEDADDIAALKAAGGVYPSSMQVVLVSDDVAAKLLQVLQALKG